MSLPQSIPDVIDVTRIAGPEATVDGAPSLVIEVPHGATTAADFEAVRRLLKSPLPADLIDFFFVNTDTGAPELAEAIAERVVASAPTRSVVLLRSRIPRTFIDCNRRLDASLAEFKAGGVAPGLMPWITAPDDVALLRERYDRYVAATRAAADALADDGATLLLHSYAPRTVGVEVDLKIVESLHWAYDGEQLTTWPERLEMDVIGRGPDGTLHAPVAVVEALTEALRPLGWRIGDSATYALHPSTMGWEHVVRRPGRGLCLEIRRDLFVDAFEPFAEARIDPTRVARLADLVTPALMRWWA